MNLPKIAPSLNGVALLDTIPGFPSLNKIDDAFNKLKNKFQIQIDEQPPIEKPSIVEPWIIEITQPEIIQEKVPIEKVEKDKPRTTRPSFSNQRLLTTSQSMNSISQQRKEIPNIVKQKFHNDFRSTIQKEKDSRNITATARPTWGGNYHVPKKIPTHTRNYSNLETHKKQVRVKWNPETLNNLLNFRGSNHRRYSSSNHLSKVDGLANKNLNKSIGKIPEKNPETSIRKEPLPEHKLTEVFFVPTKKFRRNKKL